MVENTKQLIATYLAQRSIDYALMINGAWGSGKTYFVQNSLADVLKHAKMSAVYVSLNGVDSFEEVAAQIIFGTNRGVTKETAKSFLVPFALKHLPEKSVSALLSVLQRGAEKKSEGWLGWLKTKNDLSPKKHVIILDDLERVAIPQSKLVPIMGRIFDEFIFKGYHVIFVGDESRIDVEKYVNEKEKYVRRTVRFSSDISSVIDALISSYTGIDRRHADRCGADLKHFAKICDIDNIRTIKRILDDFVLLASKVRDEAVFNNVSKTLFYNLAPIVLELTCGRLNPLNEKAVSMLQNIEMQRYAEQARKYYGSTKNTWDINDQKTQPSCSYADQFIERYDGNLPVKWFHCEPVMRFALEGCIDEEALNGTLTKWLPGNIDAYHQSLNLIWDVDGVDDKQFLESYPKVIEGIREGKYIAEEVVLACELLSIFVQRKWITIDSESLITNAVKALKKRWSDLPDDPINPMLLHHGKEEFLQPIVNAIREETSRREDIANKEDVNSFLNALSNRDKETVWSYFPNAQAWLIFDKIIKAGKSKEFVKLSNWALSLVAVNLRERGGFISRDSRKAIEQLVQELYGAIQSCSLQEPLRKARLEELSLQFVKILNNPGFSDK